MVDKIDPTNQTSVEYGQSLLKRKYEQEEKFAEEARKDRKINYAMQVLGGVDNLIKERYARNVAERNAGLDQDIIRERAEFNKLQKIYDDQSEWRKYEKLGPTAVYGYARQLANTDLTNMYGDIKTLPVDGEIRADYDKDLIRMTNQYYDNYINNKVTMPFETVEEYIAPLEALKNKQVPSGLLDIALRKTGLRKEDARSALETEISTRKASYADKLAERKGVKGSVDNLTDEDKLRLLRTPPPVKSTVEYETTIKNGLGQEVSAIGIKTTVGNDTRITGYRFPGSNEVVSLTQFHGSTKKGAEMLLNRAESKIRKMEGMEDATKRQIQNYIFANPEQFPDLKAQMYTHGLVIPRVTAFDSNEEGYRGIAEGAVSNIKNNPNHPSYDAVKTMTDVQRDALATGILESMKAINEYGRINEDGTIIYLNDVESIVSLATAEQLEGVSFAGRGMRDDVAIYKMVTPRSERVDFETLEPEEGDTPETLKSKGTRVINSLISEQSFLDADYPKRRELVEKVEGLYKTEFDVPSELLNPPATPLVDEVDEVDIFGPPKPTLDEQVEDLRRPRPEGVQLELTGDEDFDAVRAADEMLLADEGPTVQDAQDFLDREKDLLSPSRPEFRKLTREELAQQRKEEREELVQQRKEEREASRLSRKEAREYARSPEGKAESEKKTRELEDRITNYVYDKYLDPQRNDIARIQKYVDGKINKNKKPSPNTTLGKALANYGLEDMTREEIKRWLIAQKET